MELPQIISVDDHVVEPPDLWQRMLPERFRADAPRVERIKGRFGAGARGGHAGDHGNQTGSGHTSPRSHGCGDWKRWQE